MKKVTFYIAVDGTQFSSEEECVAYEKEGIADEIQKTYKEVQYLKSGVLANEDKLYMKALAKYRAACTEKMSESERFEALSSFVRFSERYSQAKKNLQKQRNRIKFLRDRENELAKVSPVTGK